MSARRRIMFWLVIGCGWVVVAGGPVAGQTPSGNQGSRLPAPQLPASSPASSPVQIFRRILAVTGDERVVLLEAYNPEVRKRLEEKVREYEALAPGERELRLRATELRYYLLQFMRSPATNRPAQLARLPEAERQLVADRLEQWDRLPTEQQREVLEYESTLQYFVPQAGGKAPTGTTAAANLPVAEQEELNRKLERWRALPENQREEMYGRFEQFFKLTQAERERTLKVLSGPERLLMEKSLQSFAQLPLAQREQCLRAFTRFAGLGNREREEFLQNAGRWQEMSPAERQVWRNLVRRLPQLPQMPPLPPPPLPAAPRRASPGFVPGGAQVVTTTNGGL